jgi:uncharacterized repeat protein (TIGR01451 family)
MAVTFLIEGEGDEQCDEKAAHNDVECPEPCVEITKTVDCDVSAVGEEVTYTICIENCGDFDLTDVTVLDLLLGDLSDNFPDTLTPGQEACADFPYTIPADALDPLSNEAGVFAIDSCDGVTEVFDKSEEVLVDLVEPCLDVDVECISEEAVVPGGEAAFRITLNNCGDVDLLVDVITSEGECEVTDLELFAGGSAWCDFTVPVPADFAEPEICVTVTADWSVAGDGECLPTGQIVEEGCCALSGDTFCSFTQGFWGNKGGKACDGTKTEDLIAGCVPLTVGLAGHSITLNTAECVIDLLPAGGTPAVLPAGDFTCPAPVAIPSDLLNKQGRFNNVLIGQVVALTLNICVSPDCIEDSDNLAGWILPAEFCTVPADDPEACPEHYTIPEDLVGLDVSELLAAANAALAGDPTYSLGDIYAAVTAINEGFDECRSVVPCPEEEICDNGCDDDFDGYVDCEDEDCVADPACVDS